MNEKSLFFFFPMVDRCSIITGQNGSVQPLSRCTAMLSANLRHPALFRLTDVQMHDIIHFVKLSQNLDRNVPLLKGVNMEVSMTSVQLGENKFKRQVADFKEV